MASKRNVQFTRPEVPSFLKKFKERVGYKEPANINDKFADDAESKSVEEDEREVKGEEPVIVVLKEGDMTAEEVEKYKKENNTDCWDSNNDKPVFKKPIKRPSSEKAEKQVEKKKKSNVKVKPVKNSNLLSFDEDEDEDG